MLLPVATTHIRTYHITAHTHTLTYVCVIVRAHSTRGNTYVRYAAMCARSICRVCTSLHQTRGSSMRRVLRAILISATKRSKIIAMAHTCCASSNRVTQHSLGDVCGATQLCAVVNTICWWFWISLGRWLNKWFWFWLVNRAVGLINGYVIWLHLLHV